MLHDGGPVEIGGTLVELDVAAVEPRLERVEVADVDGVDVQRFLCEILWNEDHVEVLQSVKWIERVSPIYVYTYVYTYLYIYRERER